MWVLQTREGRGTTDDLWLGASTAVVAGLVNVCSVMIFFAFSSNVTGHAATFAEQFVKGQWYQVVVVLAWMAMFIVGAFLANLSVTMVAYRFPHAGHASPLLLQAALLCGVAYYGHRYYLETLWETEVLVGLLLLTMGLQNGTVASVSNSVVRTTHLTGLFTDLAMELSMILQPRFRGDARLSFRLKLHSLILASYLVGGLVGGAACMLVGFRALYLGSMMLGLVLARDWLALRRSALSRDRIEQSDPGPGARSREVPSLRPSPTGSGRRAPIA